VQTKSYRKIEKTPKTPKKLAFSTIFGAVDRIKQPNIALEPRRTPQGVFVFINIHWDAA
jgi:hypothetical protein